MAYWGKLRLGWYHCLQWLNHSSKAQHNLNRRHHRIHHPLFIDEVLGLQLVQCLGQLERALDLLASKHCAVTVAWHPFQLNPEMPPEGVERKQYRIAKFGSLERSQQLDQRITETAATVGLEFHLDRITRTPNTVNAHRLIHWAGLEGRQTPMVAALMRAYWVEGRDIGSVVFPDSILKVFLTASATVRAERRVRQIEERGQQADFQAIYNDLVARDKRDTERAVAPLKPCEDALVLDCSAMPIDQVVGTIHGWAQERI